MKKTILFLSDSILTYSGVARMGKNIILGLVSEYNIVQLGATNIKNENKTINLSLDIAKETGVEDASVIIHSIEGYGNQMILRHLINKYNPCLILHFTDPRRWIWLYQMEHEIRTKIPLMYYHVWDNYPAPLYNKAYYESCDSIMCISKLTQQIVKDVTDRRYLTEEFISYVPHGIDEKYYFPITDEMYKEKKIFYNNLKEKLLDGKDYSFIAFYNNRNIPRKNVNDIILSFFEFVNEFKDKEEGRNCLLILKTDPLDPNGSNLYEIIGRFKNLYVATPNIKIIKNKLTDEELNYLYNVSSVTLNIAGQEGWGLSSTESMLAGTMIINTVTGGLQDQCRFSNENGEWISVLKDRIEFNHLTKYGDWCIPLYPAVRTLIGSQPTPYLFDDKISIEQLVNALYQIYILTPEERKRRGLKGRKWALSEEAEFTLTGMNSKIKQEINYLLENWKPKQSVEIIKF